METAPAIRWLSRDEARRICVGIAIFATVTVVCLIFGYVASRPSSLKLAAGLAAIGVCATFSIRRPGIAIGILVLATLNGLPGFDTATTSINGLAVSNYLALLLIAFLAVRWAVVHRSNVVDASRVTGVLATALVAWWLITLNRSTGEPLSAAISFGRNYLVFGLLVALFPATLRTPRIRRDALLTVAIGAGLYSLGQILITGGGGHLSWLVHPVAIRTSDVGLQRVYAFMSDAAVLLFCLSIGAALLASSRRTRQVGIAGALIAGASILLQQTRAIYLSLLIAIALLICVWGFFVPSTKGRLTGRSIRGMVLCALFLGALAIVGPDLIASYISRPLSRLTSVFSETSGSTGNIGYRLNVAHDLTNLLGGSVGHWLIGLGFLNPEYRYFAGLPLGTIRNPDLGLLDGIMLIGLIGVSVIYGIVIVALYHAITTVRSWTTPPLDSWIIFGLSIWLTQVMLASYSLTTLFQEPGGVLTALAVGILVTNTRRSSLSAVNVNHLAPQSRRAQGKSRNRVHSLAP